ncbi:MAG TPA: 16S rRNA (adenine(1518)-N(6)/adenine(1519)-N(6))-dimethyltransferase RsmA [Pseudobdellovibrionaceae bacterium]|jgi:16S rRNA (adenine1518-N6/adenine1519-N6)-dimethyltransferase
MSTARERLQEVQEALGIAAKRSLGQNFLVSDLVIEKIIKKAQDFRPAVLIEVGPGPGALTYFLRKMECDFLVIELDRVLSQYWRDQGLNVVEGDALQMDWRTFYQKPGKKVLVSNLPYQISSSIVVERCLDCSSAQEGLDHMVLMFQKEVAQRIAAKAKSENYGFLTVMAQTFWKTETVTEAGPRDFSPPPRVASRVLAFSRRLSSVQNPKAYLTFVKSAFAQRRKLLKKNISSLCSQKGIAEEQLVSWITEMGFTETARAEELTPEQFVTLYKKFGFET